MRTNTSLSIMATTALVLATAAATQSAHAAPPGSGANSGRDSLQRAGGWTQISTGRVNSLSEITVQRTSDGVLHAVYAQEVGSSSSYEHSTLSSGGSVTGHSDVLGTWATLVENPKLLAPPTGGLRLVFSGNQDVDSNNFYTAGFGYDTTSDASGSTWALQPHALTRSGTAYTGYGVGATTLSSGVPVTAATLNDTIYYRVGDIATTDSLTVASAPEDGRYTTTSCCLSATQLVNSGDNVWMAWYANGGSDATNGTFVQQIYPSLGAVLKAPGSSVGVDSLDPAQSVAMVARPGGSVVLAYTMGYPTTKAIGLWQVGSPSATKVPGSMDAAHVALSSGVTGRMWLAWSDDDNDAYALRTSPQGFGLGATQTLSSPAGSSDLRSVAVDASLNQGTVLVNDTTSQSVFARSVNPGLTLKVRPGSLKVGKKKKLTFTVTDAGEAVAGVRVRGGGTACTTNSSGTCATRVRPNRPGRIVVNAKRSGYGAATRTLRVRR